MRAVLPAVALVTLLVAASAHAETSSGTSLRITYWDDPAKPTESVTWTLRCNPPRGSLALPARACAKLARVGAKLFASTPKNVVCTEIYGGPQRARVVGTVNGNRVLATFSRTNGCAISRWQRISPWLVPPGGVT
jgi:hypothetical protein